MVVSIFISAVVLAALLHGGRLSDLPIAADAITYLDGTWTASTADHAKLSVHTIKGSVPGDLITDLQAASLVGDPLHELNFMNATMWDSFVWTYTTTFNIAAEAMVTEEGARADGSPSYLLVFDGVKMGASIYVNKVLLGQTSDQFLRYTFPLTKAILQTGVMSTPDDTTTSISSTHTLTVEFSPNIDCDGRWMGCSGGWDWAPYTTTKSFGIPTFSKGIWKSVYVAKVSTVAIKHVVPQITYLGQYPTAPLAKGAHGSFKVDVKAHLWTSTSTKGTLTVVGSWGQTTSKVIEVKAGESVSIVSIDATASDVELWWPAGHGAQPLYNVIVSFRSQAPTADTTNASTTTTTAAAATVSATRRVGFRVFAVVTGDDSDPDWVNNNTNGDGTASHGMYWRINGAAILSKGANMIPMEELEGRMSAEAHRQLVVNAVEGGMNTLRVWGGGIFLPRIWYEACDELGIMVYHDMQYTKGGHLPANTTVQGLEIRHNVRRLAHHPSIVLWDGCNECLDEALVFVMTIVVQEDSSRSIWPSSPALGWASGVNTLTTIPNGKPLITRQNGSSLESHGPYQHGAGFPSVNGDRGGPGPFIFPSNIPIQVYTGPTGIQFPNIFASEFGASVFSSFESMSPTLDDKHWGIHAGGEADKCQNGTDNPMHCVGTNPMSARNYPCDNIIEVYFGKSDFDLVGEGVFKKQLWQCMVGQALVIKQNIEARRSRSIFGIIVWQFNEIWPTGGWGSIEYGTVGWTDGQVLGGRWKPLQYWYKSAIFAEVVATCGGDSSTPQCYVNNDRTRRFEGSVVVTSIDFASGKETVVKTVQLDMDAGVGVTQRFGLGVAVSAKETMLHAVVRDSYGVEVSTNFIPFTEPKNFDLPKPQVHFTVAPTANPDGTIDITVTADKVVVYLTFTTLAQGRFSDNAFVMLPGVHTIQFLPIQGFVMAELTSSLRAEHMASYT